MSYIIGADWDRVDTSAQFALGQIGQDANGAVYKYITYNEATAAVDGVADEVCYYVAGTGYANNDVTSDLSDSDEVGAGVLMAALSDNEFGWIKIKGIHTLSIAIIGITADGDPLTPAGAADGSLDVSAAVTDHVCAYAADESANEILCDFPY